MITKYEICYDDEGYFECVLNDGTRIDICFDTLYRQIEIDNPKLFAVIDKYPTWEDGISFLEWIDEPFKPYLNNYLDKLCRVNGGTIEDLVWHKNEEGEWAINL